MFSPWLKARVSASFSWMPLVLVLSFALLGSPAFAQPWSYDFGTGTGTYETKNTSSTTFMPQPASGNDRIWLCNQTATGVGFYQENQGEVPIGVDTELRIGTPLSNNASAFSKFQIYDYSSPTNRYYVRFSMRLEGNAGARGTVYFFAGMGGTYDNNSAFDPAQNHCGLSWDVAANGTVSAKYCAGSTWTNLAPSFQLGRNYEIEIYGNNDWTFLWPQPHDYVRNGLSYTVEGQEFDLWVNGVRYAGLPKSNRTIDQNIDSFMFYTKGTGGTVPLNLIIDDIVYSNDLPDSDTVAPTVTGVTRSNPAEQITSASSVTWNLTFNENVAGLDIGDALSSGDYIVTVLPGGSFSVPPSVTSVSGSGSTYTVTVDTGTGVGEIRLDIPSSAFLNDRHGNEFVTGYTSGQTYIIDKSGPTGSLTINDDASHTNSTAVTLQLSATDVGASGVADMQFSNDGATWSAWEPYATSKAYTLSANAGTKTVYVRFRDASGNVSASPISDSIILDTTAPTVSLDPLSAYTNSSPFSVTANFSEAVTGFSAADILVGNGTASEPTGSGSAYSFTVTPSGQGAVTVQIVSAAAKDAANNFNSLASNEVSTIFDDVQPSVTLTSSVPAYTNQSSFTVTATFSEAVSGFDLSDVQAPDRGISNFMASGNSYTWTIHFTSEGGLVVSIPADLVVDATGNTNAQSTNSISTTYDITPPTFTLTTTAPSLTNEPIDIHCVASEPVLNFDNGNDVFVTNDDLFHFAILSSTEWEWTIWPGSEGVYETYVKDGICVDRAGNANAQSGSISRTFDSSYPTVALTPALPLYVNGPFAMTATFSKSVSGFTNAGQLSIQNCSITNFSGSGTTYSWTVNPTAEGLVRVSVPASVAVDSLGNPNEASLVASTTFDATAPTVILNAAPGPFNSSFTVSAVFSEAVTGFDASDLFTYNCSISGFVGAAGTNYSWTVTPITSGFPVNVSIEAAKCVDRALNSNLASEVLTRLYDGQVPNVMISSAVGAYTNGPFVVEVEFTEGVTGFTASDISAPGCFVSEPVGYEGNYTVLITPQTQGGVVVSLGADAAFDVANNGNTAAPFVVTTTYDSIKPVLTLNSSAGDYVNGSFTVQCHASEPIDNLGELDDLDVFNAEIIGFVLTDEDDALITVLPTDPGPVSVQVKAGRASDAAGNTNNASNTIYTEYDNTAVTVALQSDAGTATRTPFTVTATFSEAVNDFGAEDLDLWNCEIGTISGSGTTYTWTVTPWDEGLVSVSIPAGVAHDGANNPNAASATLSTLYDITGPTPSLTCTAPNLLNAPFSVTVNFGETVTGFDQSDLTLVNAQVNNFQGSGATYSFTLVPQADGLSSVRILAGKAVDLAGNTSNASATLSRTYDATRPTIVLDSTVADGATNTWFTVTASFSEAVTGFDETDLEITNGTVWDFWGWDGDYSWTVVPIGEGGVIVSVAAGAAEDAVGNACLAAVPLSTRYDTSGPVFSLDSDAASVTSGPFAVDCYMNEPVTNFGDLGDIVVENGTVSGFVLIDSQNATFMVQPTANGPVNVYIPAGVAQDSIGNANPRSATLSRTYDSTPLTVTFSYTVAPRTNSAFTITATFNKPVTDFAVGDITKTNCTLSDWTGNGQIYTWTVQPQNQGSVTFSIPSNVVHDSAGNGNVASTSVDIFYDTTAPSVTLTAPNGAVTNGTFIVKAIFDESVSSFDPTDLIVTNGSVTSSVGTGPSYTFAIMPEGDGDVTVQARQGGGFDAAGNGNNVSAVLTVSCDTTSPQADWSSAAPTYINSPLSVDLVFDEPVTGLEIGDFITGNCTVTGLVPNGNSYAVMITPFADGAISVQLPANRASDAAKNGNRLVAAFSRIYDITRPTIGLSSSISGLTNVPFTMTASASEELTDFDQADLSVENATISAFNRTGNTYTWTVTPQSDGLVSVSIADNKTHDRAGNGSRATAVYTATYDIVQPTVTLTTFSSAVNAPFAVQATFSEAVGGFTQGDLVVSANAQITHFGGIGAIYTWTVTPTAQGDVTISMNANAATDLAGNNSMASDVLTVKYDTTAPTINLTTEAGEYLNSSFEVTATLTEDTSDFTEADVSASNAGISDFSGSGKSYTWTVTPTSEGSVVVSVNAGRLHDAATNTNPESNQISVVYDLTAPTVQLESFVGEYTNSPFTVTATLSEPIDSFTADDITLVNCTLDDFSGSGQTYTWNITAASDGEVQVSVDPDKMLDRAGNPNTNSNVIITNYDDEALTAQLESTIASATNADSFLVNVHFNKPVEVFNRALVSKKNCNVTDVTGSGTDWNFLVSPISEGQVIVRIDADKVLDLAGNSNTASNAIITVFDQTKPTVDLDTAAGSHTNSSFVVSIALSEEVSGFDSSDINVTNGTVAEFTGSGTSYSCTIQPVDDGMITVQVLAAALTDVASNENEASNSLNVIMDRVAPSLMLSSSVGSSTQAFFVISATFNEPVTGFTSDMISVTNGSISNFTGSGASYSWMVVPTEEGSVRVNVAAGVIADQAGNLNSVSNDIITVFDTAWPSVVSITPSTLGPTPADSIVFTIVFSETVKNFNGPADVLIRHSGTAHTGVTFSGSGNTYQVRVNGITGDGTFTLSVKAHSDIADEAGNPLAALVQSPEVTIDQSEQTAARKWELYR